MKLYGRKELTFSTEQIPRPWEFSFSNFPKDALCGCSMIFYYANMIGPLGPMKTQWPLWNSPRANKGRVYIWGAFLCMLTWWCPPLLTEYIGKSTSPSKHPALRRYPVGTSPSKGVSTYGQVAYGQSNVG